MVARTRFSFSSFCFLPNIHTIVLGRKIAGNLKDELQDGVLLCEVVNKIQPNTCRLDHVAIFPRFFKNILLI